MPGALALGVLALHDRPLLDEAGNQVQDAATALADAIRPPVLHAAGPGGSDSDGDGLTDVFEEILGTGTQRPDSDGDGYWDAEEFARQSDPLDKNDIPVATPATCGMGIYEKGKNLRPVVAVYVADGDIRSADLAMGARVGNQLRGVPLSFFSKNSTIVRPPAFNSQSVVYVFDGTLNPQHVHRFGDLSVYSTIEYRDSIISADAVNLASVGGLVVEHQLLDYTSSSSGPTASLVTGQTSNGLYTPLTGATGAPPPSSWVSGKVCSQQMVVSGVNGAVVLQEVVAAECESGWATFCGSECASSAGSTISMLDPLALIGG